MKKMFACLIFYAYGALCVFAQTGANAIFNTPGVIINKAASLGLDEKSLDDLVRNYLENIFNMHIKKDNLKVTELSYTPDYNVSTNELKVIDVKANFVNFSINNRILHGRLETRVKVKRRADLRGRPGIEPQEKINIILLVNDQLSNELRNAKVTEYINKNYKNPIGINLFNERVETYSNEVRSYVSSVVNNDSYVYLRAIFNIPQPKTENVGDIFTIKETPWEVNRVEVLTEKKLPDKNAIRKDIQDEGGVNNLFEQIRGEFLRNNPQANPLKRGSKIESISKITPVDGNSGMIKLEIDLNYKLDRSGGPGSKSRHEVKIFALYQFNAGENKWEFQSIETLLPRNIKTLKS
ncbi:MAG: hypothetical protein LBH16_10835 [Treponema sp.]|nr:hypothetical protein [Treponema sp.]